MSIQNAAIYSGALVTGVTVGAYLMPVVKTAPEKIATLLDGYYKCDDFDKSVLREISRLGPLAAALFTSLKSAQYLTGSDDSEASFYALSSYAGMLLGGLLSVPAAARAIALATLKDLGASEEIENDFNDFVEKRASVKLDGFAIEKIKDLRAPFITKHGSINYTIIRAAEATAQAAAAFAASALIAAALLRK